MTHHTETTERGGRQRPAREGRLRRTLVGVLCALALAALPIALTAQTAVATDVEAEVDAVFAKWASTTTPGCAVGVATDGRMTLGKGYGMADLEHDVPIAADTIFESGSVSKQFTAAAVLQLARDGRLSLDDPVRKYVPELPEYGTPLTIRHMLNHTSGLRDWGSVASIAGWPRTTRVHTHAHVLEIVERQRATNFTPGTRWSYSNTGFNLAAIIVERVSGQTFQDFSRARLFEPLGLSRTSWRDDHTRIVKHRAVAYRERDGFHIDMPFENVYGNGGLLTTVGDLLTWTAHFDRPGPDDRFATVEQQRPGRFTDGRTHGYALGLFVGTYKGVREVYHSGSTAGYSAHLTRFPDQRLAVAVLCNANTARATEYAHAVAEIYLADRVKLSDTATAEPRTVPGLYRSRITGAAITVGNDGKGLGSRRWAFDNGNGSATATDEYGSVEDYERVAAAAPSADDLATYAGAYVSDAAETELRVVVEPGGLVLKRRPDTTIALTPIYKDAFTAPSLGTIVFRRDANGRLAELSVVQDRVWDLRFERRPSSVPTKN